MGLSKTGVSLKLVVSYGFLIILGWLVAPWRQGQTRIMLCHGRAAFASRPGPSPTGQRVAVGMEVPDLAVIRLGKAEMLTK